MKSKRFLFLLCLLLLAAMVVRPAQAMKAAGGISINEFHIPNGSGLPDGITAGPDGNVWFAEHEDHNIGRITPGGTIKEFHTSNSITQDITSGPDGNLWFTEDDANKSQIGKMNTSGVVIAEYPLSTPNNSAFSIATGPDGNLWFTEGSLNKIGRITLSGTITEFLVSTPNSLPWDITSGPDGNLWFTELVGNNIGRITPSGTITEFPISTSNSNPEGITSGPDGNLWFTEYNGDNIGRITPSGTINEFALPTYSGPTGITSGPDGNLWFTGLNNANPIIGEMNTSGTVIAEYPVPDSNSENVDITAGPDGNLWFTEFVGNNIGRVNIAPIKPGGLWVNPTKDGFSVAVGKSYTFKAYAYPTHKGDPAIDHVNFTVTWPGHPGYVDICGNVKQHTKRNVYSCTTDFSNLNNGIPIPRGSLTVTFNVTDVQGNVNYAPNGPHTGTISSPLLNVAYIDQFQGQKTQSVDCGPTSVAMALYFQHRIGSLDKNAIVGIRQATGKPKGELNTEDLDTALNSSQYNEPHTLLPSSTSTDTEVASMLTALQQGHTSVVLIDASVPGLNRSYTGHFFLLVGVSPDGNTMYVNDPDDKVNPPGVNGGPDIPISMTVFKAAIESGKQYDSLNNVIIVA